jgi:lipid II:glycine glycyltransferase (peptidoglycan interpeptide bridge formation enzyme)
LCFKDDVPIASGLSFHSSTVTLCKFVGIDPQYREYQAYFLMYYELIKKALERNQKRIYFGPSTYEFKQKIGCKKENRYGFVKLKNPLLHYVLKSFLTTSKLSGKKF